MCIRDRATGANIVRVAAEAPLKQIAVNAGLEGGVVVEKVRNLGSPREGLNAATGDYEDLVKAGVIDPVKVTRSALQNAASIAALFLTTEAVIADKPEKAAPAMPGGDGGMVLQQRDVGLEGGPAGVLYEPLQEERGRGTARHPLRPAGLERIGDGGVQHLARHLVPGRNGHHDERRARQPKLIADVHDGGRLGGGLDPHVDRQAAVARGKGRELVRAITYDRHPGRLQPLERGPQVKDGLGPGADDGQGRGGQGGQIVRDIVGRVAVHAAHAARGKNVDTGPGSDGRRGGHGRGAVSTPRYDHGQVAPA